MAFVSRLLLSSLGRSRVASRKVFLPTHLHHKGSLSRPLSTIVPGVGLGKTSTGLTGIPVDHDAVQKIIDKNQAILDLLESGPMPKTATYYEVLDKLCNYRIGVAKENLDDPEKVEELCRCGQVEELVMQADDELDLLQYYLKERIWEHVKPVEIQFHPEHDAVPEDEEK